MRTRWMCSEDLPHNAVADPKQTRGEEERPTRSDTIDDRANKWRRDIHSDVTSNPNAIERGCREMKTLSELR